ncbi:MAG: hypothetical protein IJ389_02465 [Clostridia bacterium]|nr:hypothetical protein [Clostridia bacterium]
MDKFEFDPQEPIQSLLSRAELLLKEEQWYQAEAYCQVVLDMDSENVTAYLYRLMAELNVNEREKMAEAGYTFKNSDSYIRLTELCDDDLRSELEQYAEAAEQAYAGDDDGYCEEEENHSGEKGVAVKIIVGVFLGLVLVAGAIFLCINATPYLHTLSEYNNAIAILESGDYDVARTAFDKLDGFKDSEEYVNRFSCLPTYTEEIIKERGKDEVYNRVDYQYEKNGSILKSTVTDRDGNILSTRVNLYDDNGLIISSEISEEGNNSSSSYGYNNAGQLIRETVSYESGEKVVYEYIYNDKGYNTEKRKTSVVDGKESSTVEYYEYNDDGLAIKCTYTKNEMTVSTTTFEYDEYGNRTVATGDNGTSSKYEYLYDMDGNLLKIIEKSYKRGDVLQSEIERNYCDYHYYYKS